MLLAEADAAGDIAEPEDHAVGRSRGGLSTKIHHACDGKASPWRASSDLTNLLDWMASNDVGQARTGKA